MPKFTLLILFLVPVVVSLTAQPPAAFNENRQYSADTVKKALHSMFTVLSERHPGFYRYHTRQSMQSYVDSIKQTITGDSLSLMDIYRKFKPVVGRVECLHTGLALPADYQAYLDEQPNLLPFQLYFLDHKAYIIKNFSADKTIQPGSELIQINGVGMKEIVQKILPGIPSDGYNMTMKYRALYHNFPTWYRSMVESVNEFKITVVHNGQSQQLLVPGGRFKDMAGENFLEEYKYPKQLEFSIDNNISRITIHSFAKSAFKRSGQQFKKLIKSSFRELKQKKIENLIVDLRNNNGGTDAYAAYFTRYFFDKPFRYWDRIEVTEPIAKEIKGIYKLFYKKPIHKDSSWLWRKTWVTKEFNFYKEQKPARNHFTGNVYVLTNGFCMSSCADVAAVLSYNKKATIIGEETGGGFQGNNSGMMPQATLLAGMRLTVPLQAYYTAVDPDVNTYSGTIPDYISTPSVDNILKEEDVVMQYVLKLIKESSE